MEMLVWGGAIVTVAGMIGIIYSVVLVTKARRSGLDDDALRTRLAKILPINLGALFLSMIGLMMVVVGILLG
jgi:hypothetical protein